MNPSFGFTPNESKVYRMKNVLYGLNSHRELGMVKKLVNVGIWFQAGFSRSYSLL